MLTGKVDSFYCHRTGKALVQLHRHGFVSSKYGLRLGLHCLVVPFFDIAMSFDNLFQRIASIYDRFGLTRVISSEVALSMV